MPGTVYWEMLVWLWGGVILEQLMEPWAKMAILVGSPRSSRGCQRHRVSSERWVVPWAEVGQLGAVGGTAD